MAQELLPGIKDTHRPDFDPRTKLLVFLSLVLIILGGSYQTAFFYVPALVPLCLLIHAGLKKGWILYSVIFCVSFAVMAFGLPQAKTGFGFLVSGLAALPLYMAPSFAMAYYTFSTTTVSELLASMERMHVPRAFTISMAVMFRFFPTVYEEWKAIGEAMRMRDIRLLNKGPAAMIEYRLVPMLMSSIKTGEELSQASLTRGLDGPVKRTNICHIGFSSKDYLLIAISLTGLAVQVAIWLGVFL